ncbi:MAG: ABC transporter permease [Streptosporangiaceae bacterium]
MSTTPVDPTVGDARRGRARSLSGWLYQRPRVRLSALLSAPLLWLVVVYLGSLAALLMAAFWTTNDFTGQVVYTWTLENFKTIITIPVYRKIVLQSIFVAASVTVVDAVIALPIAFYMGKLASPRTQRFLVLAILMPLWANYLVKLYAWRVMFANGSVIDSVLRPLGLGSPGYGLAATIVGLAYLWLPYMILPLYAGFDRLPNSLLDASSDLGARSGRTFRAIVLPIVFPALVAGSIFTFSLSLGDYIAPQIVGGATQLIGNVVYDNIGAANNLPFAAAVATLPVIVMLLYLFAVRRTGALQNL